MQKYATMGRMTQGQFLNDSIYKKKSNQQYKTEPGQGGPPTKRFIKMDYLFPLGEKGVWNAAACYQLTTGHNNKTILVMHVLE